MLESIKNINGTELNENSEKLLNSMKKLRRAANDVIGTAPLKELKQGCHNLVINVGDDEYPVYYNATTVFAGGSPEITDDIYDEENYLGVTDDDEMMWFALTLQLAHQVDLLQEDNNKYSDELVDANEEIDKLRCELAEEIKTRQGYEEALKQLREENNQLKEFLNAADNEIEGLEESLREANKTCTEHVKENVQLEIDNKRLSERVKTLVCDKCNGKDLPLKFGEQERLGSKQADKILEDYEASKETVNMDMEMAILHQNNLELNNKVTHLTNYLETVQKENNNLKEELDGIKNNNAYLKKEKEEAELLAYRLTRGEMRVQFDSMKSLEHENEVLKHENAELNQKLCQKEDEDDLRKRIAEYAQKNADLLECNKRLNQEISKLRVQFNSYSGATVVDKEETHQKITKEAMAELTAKINELEEANKNLQKENEEQNKDLQFKDNCIFDLSKDKGTLSVENQNLKEQIEKLKKEKHDAEHISIKLLKDRYLAEEE